FMVRGSPRNRAKQQKIPIAALWLCARPSLLTVPRQSARTSHPPLGQTFSTIGRSSDSERAKLRTVVGVRRQAGFPIGRQLVPPQFAISAPASSESNATNSARVGFGRRASSADASRLHSRANRSQISV